MSPNDPDPIFLTSLYLPPTMNSDLEAEGADAMAGIGVHARGTPQAEALDAAAAGGDQGWTEGGRKTVGIRGTPRVGVGGG